MPTALSKAAKPDNPQAKDFPPISETAAFAEQQDRFTSIQIEKTQVENEIAELVDRENAHRKSATAMEAESLAFGTEFNPEEAQRDMRGLRIRHNVLQQAERLAGDRLNQIPMEVTQASLDTLRDTLRPKLQQLAQAAEAYRQAVIDLERTRDQLQQNGWHLGALDVPFSPVHVRRNANAKPLRPGEPHPEPQPDAFELLISEVERNWK